MNLDKTTDLSKSRLGKKKVSVYHIGDPKSLSPLQRRHYKKSFVDDVNLSFKKGRKKSAYLEHKQSLTPDMKNNLYGDERSADKSPKPTKKIFHEKHLFNKSFF